MGRAPSADRPTQNVYYRANHFVGPNGTSAGLRYRIARGRGSGAAEGRVRARGATTGITHAKVPIRIEEVSRMRIFSAIGRPAARAGVLAVVAAGLLSSAVSAQAAEATAGSRSVSRISFVSEAYAYTMQLPAGWAAVPADLTWDGQSQIDSSGVFTDKFTGPRGEFMFVFGAPTTLAVSDYATQQQEWTASWHGCPSVPDDARDAVLDDRPARVHSFICQGVQVFKLMAVADGAGLVVNQIMSPGDVETLREGFLSMVAAIDWHPSPASQAASPLPGASPSAS